MLTSDPAWYEDVRCLVRRPGEFWPSRDQTPEERLNSVTRLLLYCGAALALYKRHHKWVVFAVVMAVLLAIAHATAPRHHHCGGTHEGGTHEGGTHPAALCARGVGGIRPCTAQRPAQRPHGRPRCTPSTPDNPFANMLVSDLATNPGRPPACAYDSQQDAVRQNFNRGLVRNVYDIYEKENSQRQFMTMPVTTSAPDTVAFAQFCYGNAGRPTCKESPSRCTGAFP